jgi:hypothetical protein
VLQDGRDIGRIFKPGAGVPEDFPWMWTITGAVVMPALPSHGFMATARSQRREGPTLPRCRNARPGCERSTTPVNPRGGSLA